MGDTMREGAKAHCGPCESRCHDCPIDWEGRPELQAAFERGRQLGMEQARREMLPDEQLSDIAYQGFDDYWTEDCSGDWTEAWARSAKAVLAAHGIPTPPAGDSDTQEPK